MYKVNDYLIPLDEILSALSRLKARSIILESPIGVRDLALTLGSIVEDRVKVSIYYSGRSAWGFCDVGVNDAKLLGVDAVLHVGHVNPVKYHGGCRVYVENMFNIPVIYAPFYYDIEIPEYVAASISRVLSGNVYVAYPVNYEVTAIQLAKHLPKDVSYESSIITGCFTNISKLNTYSYILVVAGGFFHALTFKILNPNLKVLNYDPHRGEIYDVEKYFRRIYSLKIESIKKCLNAKNFAILLITKTGQYNLELANKLRRLLHESSFRSIVICADEVSNDLLSLYPSVDVFINTGCPRLAFDNIDQYEKPLINPGEVKTVITGKLSEYSLETLLHMDVG